MEDIKDIIIAWYLKHRRDLPWRDTTDPYLIWISEVILQQTRVGQGLDYYYRFTERFPDIQALASAEEDEVLKYWQGLGYYSRARNLHAAAKSICSRFQGIFPNAYDEIRSLKGVGEYTAAAIASFAFRLPYAAVDGNVFRVLSRFFGSDIPIDTGEGKRFFTGLASELMDKVRPDLFNQAMMEFGAIQCVPKSPDCMGCPLREKCMALSAGLVDKLPYKQGKKSVKARYFNYLHISGGGYTLLSKRQEKDIWQNLYEFPLIETDHLLEMEELPEHPLFRLLVPDPEYVFIRQVVPARKHVLTHRTIYALFYEIMFKEQPYDGGKYLLVRDMNIGDYPVSRLMHSYLEIFSGNNRNMDLNI